MIRIQAPYPTPVLDFYLPNPKLSDSLTDAYGVQLQYSMTGITKTLVRANQPQKLVWQFTLPKCAKDSNGDPVVYTTLINSLVQDHANATFRLTDWRGATWTVRCISNPVEFTESKNSYDCVLEFRGTKD